MTDVGTCLLVILNSMFLLRGFEEKKSLTSVKKNKACCEGKEGKCSKDVSKKGVKFGDVDKVKEVRKGCCETKKCCNKKSKIEESMEIKRGCEILSVGNKVGCCKSASNCRNEKDGCGSSSGCTQFGANTSLGVVIV